MVDSILDCYVESVHKRMASECGKFLRALEDVICLLLKSSDYHSLKKKSSYISHILCFISLNVG